MNYCIECKHYYYNTSKKAFECSKGIGRICEVPCDSYVEDAMVWVKVLREHGRLIDADKLIQYLLTIKPRNETIGTCVKCEIKDLENAPTILEASNVF